MFYIGCIIVFLIVGVVIELIGRKLFRRWKSSGDPHAIFISIIITGIWAFLSFCYFSDEAESVKSVEEYKIVAMQDTSSIAGQGSLFFINVRSDLSINYMRMNEDGSLTPMSMRSSQEIKIFEGDYEPKLMIHTITHKCGGPVLRRMFIACKAPHPTWWYEFYVPMGTVVNTFEIDLK